MSEISGKLEQEAVNVLDRNKNEPTCDYIESRYSKRSFLFKSRLLDACLDIIINKILLQHCGNKDTNNNG